jgi:2-dehydropantoate 2-reductase
MTVADHEAQAIGKVAIVGAGAMGCLFAAKLADAGAEVTLIDIDAGRLAAIRDRGVTLREDDGVRNVRVGACRAEETAGVFGLVMIFTKGMHTRAAARSVARLAKSCPIVLTLQNGIGNAQIIAEVFGTGRLLHGVADLPADLEDATTVSSRGGGKVCFGGVRHEAHRHAASVAALMNRAGVAARTDEDVDVVIWEKLAFNAALNPVGALLSMANGEVADSCARLVAIDIAHEVIDTAIAKGVAVDRGRVLERISFAFAHHRGHRASMLQDREAGRPTEIDFINGAAADAAGEAGVAAPVTRTLANLVRALERRHAPLQ